jgi:hypothetical protein
VRRPQGYVTVVGGWTDAEFDSITCGHCNQIVLVKAGTASTVYLLPQVMGPAQEEPGAMCRLCMKAVCLTCHNDGRCTPLMRRIEAQEGDRLALARLGMA